MSHSKKIKPENIIMDCIIAGVLLVVVFIIITTYFDKEDTKTETDAGQTVSTALPETLPVGDGIENYECVIADESSNDTTFYISFDTNAMTYEETLSAGEQSSSLDKGTFEVQDGKYVTTSDEGEESTYAKDGGYLIVTSELFEGEVPEGDTFSASFVYEVENEVKTTVTFKTDGTYEQEVVSYAASGSSEDTTSQSSGKYTREEGFIRRTADDGEPLLDFYIYDDRLSNAYYKLVE